MKYLVIEVDLGSFKMEMPFVFPSHMIHDEMAKSIKHNMAMIHQWMDTKVVSAGEISIESASCYGKSETLNIGSRGELDAQLIMYHNYGVGMI